MTSIRRHPKGSGKVGSCFPKIENPYCDSHKLNVSDAGGADNHENTLFRGVKTILLSEKEQLVKNFLGKK